MRPIAITLFVLGLTCGLVWGQAEPEAPADPAADHAARARELIGELGELGFAIDGERLSIEVRELEDCVDDMDRQQGLFFLETHFEGLAGLIWATSPGMEAPPPAGPFRRRVVQQLASAPGAYYQFDREALVFPKTKIAALNDAFGARDVMVAHELLHAHQAQRSEAGLGAILHRSGRTVEQVRIGHCLLEGEAELVALAIVLGREGKQLSELDEGDLDAVTETNQLLVGALDRIYDTGRRATLRAYKQGGWPAVRQLVSQDHPPSTEQMLHPEKRGQDLPVEVALPDAPAGYELIHDDVYGELQLNQILAAGFPDRGEQAAIGWDGDRLRVFQGPAGQTLFAWRTVWDREQDATQFMALLEGSPAERSGRVVDLVRGTDEAVAAAYRQALPAWEQAADPQDAETTAAIEAALEARKAARAARRDGQRWEIPAAGVAFELPEGFETEERGGNHFALLRPGTAQATANVSVIVLPNPIGVDYDQHLKLNRDQIAGIPGIELTSLEQGEVAGRPALVGRYGGAFQPGQPAMEFRLILLLRGTEQVVITGTVLRAEREAHQPAIDQLMDSLTWLAD